MYEFNHDDINPSAFGKVAVLYGGNSSEREVSLASGARVFQSLESQGFNCTLIDSQENLIEQLQATKPDVVFLALHGSDGEDGTVQGLLDAMNIPYTGSGVLASALGMDKYRSKLVWQSVGLFTPEFAVVTDEPQSMEHAESLLPAFVKPSLGGSSVGVALVQRPMQLIEAVDKAREHVGDGVVLVESLVEGPEFTVGILHGQPLPVINIRPANNFYDYAAKYLSDSTRYLVPCGLSEAQEQELQAIALTAFEVLGCKGWGRIDFMQDGDGKFWLLEANTIPGMTEHSLLPMAAKAAGLSFDQLIVEILKTANVK